MTDNVFVSYAADGVTITGIYTVGQSFPTKLVASTDPTLAAYINPMKPQVVLSQDLMAQFAVADYALIKAANAADDAKALLWAAMMAQKDPMLVTNARFKQGWTYLVAVLGQPRMNAIATALGVTVTLP